jgi:gluconate 2-dehydrogenase gamma chain
MFAPHHHPFDRRSEMGSQAQDDAGGIRRRDLLRRAGVAGAVAALPVGLAATAAAAEREEIMAVAAAESDTLNAMLARIIPSDANGPGAAEARVGRFIDRMLRSEFRAQAAAYEAGLPAVDEYARTSYGAAFTALTPDQQDAILAGLESGAAPGFDPDSTTFFAMVREHAMLGMFGDPVHGGNAGFVGWDLLGYPGVKLVFTEAQQRLDVDVRNVHKSATDYDLFRPTARGGSHHGH